VYEVESSIGYPADHVYYGQHTAGHDYEPDDLLHDTSSSCFGCGSPVSDDTCGNCGHENMMWWTGNGEGLQNFKGKVAAVQVGPGELYSCFGFIPPVLYLGSSHHMAIMAQLLEHGWTWEDLASAPQIWGWCYEQGMLGDQNKKVRLKFSTDAAAHDPELVPQVKDAFAKLLGADEVDDYGDPKATNTEYGPNFDRLYGDEGAYRGYYGEGGMSNLPNILVYNSQTGETDRWRDQKLSSWEEDLQFTRLAALDKAWSVGYNSKTANAWDEAFEEPIVDEDLGEFEQETNHLTEQEKQAQGIEGPFEIDGWTVYTRDCNNQYPTHDAIWMDRGKKIMAIGWQGGHGHLFGDSPFMFSLTANGSPYDQTTGHFRQAPSTTEPFPAGWGWHGDPASKEERNILKQIIKDHYKVDKLKDLYKSDEDAEENYFDVGNDDEIDPHASAVKALQDLTKQRIYDIIKGKAESQGV